MLSGFSEDLRIPSAYILPFENKSKELLRCAATPFFADCVLIQSLHLFSCKADLSCEAAEDRKYYKEIRVEQEFLIGDTAFRIADTYEYCHCCDYCEDASADVEIDSVCHSDFSFSFSMFLLFSGCSLSVII